MTSGIVLPCLARQGSSNGRHAGDEPPTDGCIGAPPLNLDQRHDVRRKGNNALPRIQTAAGLVTKPSSTQPGISGDRACAPSNRERSGRHGLNEAQHTAVHAPIAPLLVLAGAGTGKTRVVIARIGELIRRGCPPSRILAVTFTNKAAREMLSRLPRPRANGSRDPRGGADLRPGQMSSATQADQPEISTIHSLCCRILRRHAERAGITPRFGICDRAEQESIARRVLRETRIAEAALSPSQLLDRVGRWKNVGLDPDEAVANADDDVSHLAASSYRRYQASLRNAGLVDFDDLLMLVDRLFQTNDDVRRNEAARFDHVLVDEYQDTSSMQDRILAGLARDHASLCVVGDDDQSIYAWRGAEISHILHFKQSWPTATVVRLEENYRSTPEIIHAANLLIGHNARRLGKTLVSRAPSGPPPAVLQAEDEEDEAKRVVGELAARLRLGEFTPSQAAILVRVGELTRSFEQELRRRDVPYELVGSRSFFDRREVKDVMAMMRLLVDTDDDVSHLAASSYRRYQASLRNAGLVDFDD
ncbi:MAG: ATP-dependent helicase, partial [Planctomycetaceae bacterium]